MITTNINLIKDCFRDRLNVNRILADVAASITELKANPMKVARIYYGEPVAVLNRNEPAFYCVPAEAYEMMLDDLKI